MSILIKNVTAITLDEKNGVVRDTDIAVEGGRILSVGGIPAGFTAGETIDGRGFIAMPAFFNAHTHAAMSLERGWAEDLPFDRWLNEKIWVAESAMEKEDVYWGAALSCCEMIRCGCVGFADHYFWMDEVAQAADEAGMKAALAWCQFGIGKDKEVGGVSLDDTVSFIKKWNGKAGGRLKCFLGPHSPYMCPPSFLRDVAEKAQELGVGIHIHLSESDEQAARSVKEHKRTPVEHLEALGVLDAHCVAAHCISVSENDIAILSRKKVNVAHTPKTYMKLAMGMAPIDKFVNAGVNVCLGTDGPASNNDLNMLEVMRLTGLVHKNRLLDAGAFAIDDILKMATQNSAKALGFSESGVLKTGAAADIILFNPQKPHFYPRHNIGANIVYSSHPQDIEYVICDGKLLLDKGKLTVLDEERVIFEAEKRAFRMVGAPMNLVRSYKS